MAGVEQALFANEAFYVAFQSGDFEAMDDLWAAEHPVTCIHPGWYHLDGRDDVMDSWRDILANPQNLDIECLHARASLYGDVAVIIGYEVIGQISMVSTNIFVVEGGAWKMIHHQAGAAPVPPDIQQEAAEDRLQ